MMTVSVFKLVGDLHRQLSKTVKIAEETLVPRAPVTIRALSILIVRVNVTLVSVLRCVPALLLALVTAVVVAEIIAASMAFVLLVLLLFLLAAVVPVALVVALRRPSVPVAAVA